MKYIDPVHLRQVLTQYYSEGELRTMCFDMGIDYESIGGRGKSEKVVELIAFAQRNNRLNDFAEYIRQTRSFIQLKMTDSPPPPLDEVTGSGGTVTQVTHVYGDMVGGDKVGGDKVGGDKTTVGDITGSTGIAIGRGASAQVTFGAGPRDKETFNQQLQELKTLLEQALVAGEIDKEDGETAVSDLQDVIEETEKETPRAQRMKRRLEDISEVIGAAAKAGTAVLKATPIIAGLIKAISVIF